MGNRPVLITGCQRSGTTLLRLILNSHPDILSIDEDRFHYPSINTYLNARIDGNRFRFSAESTKQQRSESSLVCFKLPKYAPILGFLKSLPNLRILWCIREPVDVVWSMLKLQSKLDEHHTVPWAAHPGCAQAEIANAYWTLTDETRQKLSQHMHRFQKILENPPVERSRRDNIFMGALCWTIKNALLERYEQAHIGFHLVRYEELVASPMDPIRSILDYIGADWNDDVLRHHEKHEGYSIGNTNNSRPIDNRGVGAGVDNLTAEEVKQINKMCRIISP